MLPRSNIRDQTLQRKTQKYLMRLQENASKRKYLHRMRRPCNPVRFLPASRFPAGRCLPQLIPAMRTFILTVRTFEYWRMVDCLEMGRLHLPDRAGQTPEVTMRADRRAVLPRAVWKSEE